MNKNHSSHWSLFTGKPIARKHSLQAKPSSSSLHTCSFGRTVQSMLMPAQVARTSSSLEPEVPLKLTLCRKSLCLCLWSVCQQGSSSPSQQAPTTYQQENPLPCFTPVHQLAAECQHSGALSSIHLGICTKCLTTSYFMIFYFCNATNPQSLQTVVSGLGDLSGEASGYSVHKS